MARWKLGEAHYIHAKMFGEETEWEYKETDRINGRERRKRFVVPLYCEAGSIVCREGDEKDEKDIIFEGPPTPAMEPLDDEAKAITAQYAPQWVHPIDSLPGQFSSADLLAALQKQVAAASSVTPPPPVVVEGVSKEEFELLKEQMAQLMARNAELEERPLKEPKRRVA
jgi:hypothetical protein